MATQMLPSWLSYSTIIVTGADGLPSETSTTLVELPLTYYGPSIPLGPDWTYGGLTPPTSAGSLPPTSIPVSETNSPVPAPSLTPTSSFAIPSSSVPSATPSSFTPTSLASSSSIITPSPSSLSQTNKASAPSSSTSIPVLPLATGSNIKDQRIGIILGTILGSVLLLLVCLFLKMLVQRRRNRRSDARFTLVSPIDDDYFLVGIQGRSADESVPRGSGEETDPFLRRGVASPTTPIMRQTTLPVTGMSNVTRVPVPVESVSSNNTASKYTTSTNSGYGVLLEHPTLSTFRPTDQQRRGNILSAGELHRVDETRVETAQQNTPGDVSSLLPPPRLVVPGHNLTSPTSQGSLGSHRSSYPIDGDEAATLLTARRVKAEDLGPRSPPTLLKDERPNARPTSGWMSGLGLGHFTSLNWFKNGGDSSSKNPRPRSQLIPSELSDADVETGRALLNAEMPGIVNLRGGGGGLTGPRPVSGSAQSGGSGDTVYHDAPSGTPPITPLPPVFTSGAKSGNSNSRPAGDGWDGPSDSMRHTGATNTSRDRLPEVDVLDTPAPPAMSSFTSSSTLRDTDSSTSGAQTIALPPGLGPTILPLHRPWKDASDRGSSSRGSFAAGSNRTVIGPGITFEVLEDEPPRAGEGWKSLASVTSSGSDPGGRRTTFGLPQFVHPQQPTTSEQGSLHSMRSRLSPSSSRSAGSAPASRRLMSDSSGSAYSRPSARSPGRPGSFATGGTLSHSGSISSDGRKRSRTPAPMSPALSAFGQHSSVTGSAQRSNTDVPTAIDIGPGVADSIRPVSPGLHLPTMLRAGGLNHNWTPT